MNSSHTKNDQERPLYRDQLALDALRAAADEIEAGRSAYWRKEAGAFEVSTDGTVTGETVLGSFSRKTGPVHSLVHRVLQIPFRHMGSRFAGYRECEKLGRVVAQRQGRQFTHDMIRQVLTLALIRDRVGLASDGQCNLVIGDGYGVLTSLFLLAAPERRTVLVNLTKPLLLDLTHVRMAVPDAGLALVSTPDGMERALADDSVRLIAVRADDAACIKAAPIGVAANVVSMQEMDANVIAGYFAILRQNRAPSTIFYCCNKLYKRLSDGTEVRFKEYPWQENDQILLDASCPWSQWIYSRQPPFWQYRRGADRVIWHRLAVLAGERTQADNDEYIQNPAAHPAHE